MLADEEVREYVRLPRRSIGERLQRGVEQKSRRRLGEGGVADQQRVSRQRRRVGFTNDITSLAPYHCAHPFA